MNLKAKRIIKLIASHLCIGAIVATVVLITNGFCLFKYITTVDCPGCGLTRAFLAAFRGDFKAAIGYNAMFWAIPILAILAGHVSIIHKKCNKIVYSIWVILLALLIIAMIVVYIIKLVFLYT